MTSRYIYDRHDELVAWAEERIPGQHFRDDAVAIGHERDGCIVGVVVYDTFTPGSCCIGLASDGSKRWMTREFAMRAMAYPFVQCGFRRITAFVSERNEASLRFTRGTGWTQEGVLREAGPDREDMICFGMLRRECKWLPMNLRIGGAPPRHGL